jgi:GntR family transcriptional repressor for pyruvate dehydrogenase complex
MPDRDATGACVDVRYQPSYNRAMGMPDLRSASRAAEPSMPFSALPQRQSLVDTVVEQLAHRLESGAAAPGARLPAESELCRQFAVSRTVVREAVARLKADGLVETLPGLGLYVARRPPGEGVLRLRAPQGSVAERARELLEFRAGLETESARLAALRRSDADIASMREALARIDAIERAGDNGGAEDLAFHMAIARASGNGYIVQVLQFLSGSLRDAISHSRIVTARRREHVEAAQREHGLVVEAIVSADPDIAALQMRRHLINGERRLLQLDAAVQNAGARAPASDSQDKETPR